MATKYVGKQNNKNSSLEETAASSIQTRPYVVVACSSHSIKPAYFSSLHFETNESEAMEMEECSDPEPPHEALFLVLAYLPVRELLAMSEVCISVRDAVKSDVLPWLNLIVQSPLCSKLSDEILIKLASKADGRLTTLVLFNCTKITDYGLQRVVELNPFIHKVYIPSCTGITPEGVLRSVKFLCEGGHSLNTLRLNGIHNIKKDHLDILTSYLKTNQPSHPLYYHERRNLSEFKHSEEKTQRVIDLELCPKCFEVRMVYDCPRGACKKREMTLAQCRACSFCIPRCENCGVCLRYEETEESACGDVLCGECWVKEPKCNFCNKPYCKQHTEWWCRFSESGVICRVCNEEYLGYMSSNDVF